MTSRPTVSIITLTYNQSSYLAQCLETVNNQTLADWEHIVLDDDSTDDTSAILDSFQDPRRHYIRQAHAGVSQIPRSYAHALSLCSAPFIAFLDGDDYWPLNKLELLVPLLTDPATVLAYGRTVVVTAMGGGADRTIPSAAAERGFPGALTNSPVGRAARLLLDPDHLTFAALISAVLRRSALDAIGGLRFFPGLPVMDYPTLLHLSLQGGFAFAQEPTAYWRLHDDNTTLTASGTILAGTREQGNAFRRQYGKLLPLSKADWQAIDQAWSHRRQHLEDQLFLEARRQIGGRRWREGRATLRRALREPTTVKHRLFLVFCLILSLLHLDAEWAVRLLGRPAVHRRPS